MQKYYNIKEQMLTIYTSLFFFWFFKFKHSHKICVVLTFRQKICDTFIDMSHPLSFLRHCCGIHCKGFLGADNLPAILQCYKEKMNYIKSAKCSIFSKKLNGSIHF